MSQTRAGSLAESFANIAVGFAVNYGANLVILPAFGFTSLTPGKNFLIGVAYTGVSLVRSYILRRYFNGLKFGNTEPKPKIDHEARRQQCIADGVPFDTVPPPTSRPTHGGRYSYP